MEHIDIRQSKPAEFNSPSILIINDKPSLMEGIVKILAMDGYSAECVTNTDDAVVRMKETKFDLIVVDGDLGDSNYGADGISGLFIREHLSPLSRQRFVRLSTAAWQLKDAQLNGEQVFSDSLKLVEWINQEFPVEEEKS